MGRARVNAKLAPKEIRETIPMDDECKEFMRTIMNTDEPCPSRFSTAAEGFRTIAVLAGEASRKPATLERRSSIGKRLL